MVSVVRMMNVAEAAVVLREGRSCGCGGSYLLFQHVDSVHSYFHFSKGLSGSFLTLSKVYKANDLALPKYFYSDVFVVVHLKFPEADWCM